MTSRLLAYGTLLGTVLVVCLCFWPGHMSADTLAQVDQADTGELTNQHAPLLIAGWYPFYNLGFGPWFVLLLQLLAFVAGAYLVLRAAFARLTAALIVAAIVVLPQVFGFIGVLGRDTWFTSLLVLTFGLTVRAAQTEWPRRGRWIGLALAAAWFTLAARQNAAAAVIVACVALAAMLIVRWAARREPRPAPVATPRRTAIASLVAGAALTVAMMGSQVLAGAALGVRDVDPEQYLFIYDLAALSQRENEDLFPEQVLAGDGLEAVNTYWNVDSVNGLVFSEPPPVRAPLDAGPASVLRDAWVDEVTAQPDDYLWERTRLFARNLGLTRDAMWVFHPAIDPNPYGYEIAVPWANEIAGDYLGLFADRELDGGSPLHAAWIYLLLAAGCCLFLLRRGRPPAILVIGGLGLSVILYQVGLFFGAMGTQYRFQVPTVVAALLVGSVAVKWALEHRRQTSESVAAAPRASADRRPIESL